MVLSARTVSFHFLREIHISGIQDTNACVGYIFANMELHILSHRGHRGHKGHREHRGHKGTQGTQGIQGTKVDTGVRGDTGDIGNTEDTR